MGKAATERGISGANRGAACRFLGAIIAGDDRRRQTPGPLRVKEPAFLELRSTPHRDRERSRRRATSDTTQPSASDCSTGLEKHPSKDDGSLASRKEPLTCMHDLRRYHGLAHAVTFRHRHNPILGRGQLPRRTVQKKSGAPHCRISGPPPPRSVEQAVCMVKGGRSEQRGA